MARLVHFTLASDDAERTQAFYGAVFDERFDAVQVGDDTLYRGKLAGLGMVICPAAMADVVANRSRHQIQLEVDDVRTTAVRALEGGGRIHTPYTTSNGRDYAVICDPDNNTIELVGYPEVR